MLYAIYWLFKLLSLWLHPSEPLGSVQCYRAGGSCAGAAGDKGWPNELWSGYSPSVGLFVDYYLDGGALREETISGIYAFSVRCRCRALTLLLLAWKACCPRRMHYRTASVRRLVCRSCAVRHSIWRLRGCRGHYVLAAVSLVWKHAFCWSVLCGLFRVWAFCCWCLDPL